MRTDLIYILLKETHTQADLIALFNNHSEIKFVSLVGVDLAGNDTDEKIPVKIFLESIDDFLNGIAVQTDGSSVVLPGIATLDNGKVDMVADLNINWFIDYNYDLIDPVSSKPIGTIRIPCFLIHDGKAVDSRRILKNSIEFLETSLLDTIKNNDDLLDEYKISKDDIDKILLTSATELEFWVKTPNDKAHVEELTTSEVLQEQYWTRTKGAVRTAMEESLILMDLYGFEPEMGHKEVGGVKATLTSDGQFDHIMEQLEIDWKYSNALQAADNELFIRTLIKETFREHGLEVTFLAKPINGVAGSGEHTHLGIAMKLKSGKIINLFNTDDKNHYLSKIGYGALMGMLKNYEVMNPFISSTTDSLKRLSPGFEAPVCIVTSLGKSPDVPSRNRTILIGLIRDFASPLATRFELRSPNPFTNTYLCIAVSYLAMYDGIKFATQKEITKDILLSEISKKAGDDALYLEKDREYRSEEDIYEFFTAQERDSIFGIAPATVYEVTKILDSSNDKLNILKVGDVLDDKLINSFKTSVLKRWTTEIPYRTIPKYARHIRGFKQIHTLEKALDLDMSNWEVVHELRLKIMKDTHSKKSLFSKLVKAIEENNLELLSELQLELQTDMKALRNAYSTYKRNLLDI
ncbi:glutamine synthetase [uncultured Clostridium sp.]|uniref:glutamine synthetase n=1 Tax=uncultured Clostridium sp. TaxID=59620 RepID=UPI00261B8479|nr:glutamine synthetase [uncultured Clostridium sp.]